jgi:hypothetical protein
VSSPRDRDKYFVDEERVAEPWMTVLESLREEWAELVAPEPNRLVARFDPPFGEQILDVAVAEVEAVLEPDRVPDDGGWETVPLVRAGGSVHSGMVAQARLI